jgi:hypothetical protein
MPDRRLVIIGMWAACGRRSFALYDSLLDELEDDVVSNPQEVEDLTVKVVDAEEADADLLVDDNAGCDLPTARSRPSRGGDRGKRRRGRVLIEQVENWSDDPVRMYLTQMGEIPLLTRAQEIYLARQIETTRAQFRAKLLECEYVCQQAFKVLSRVHRGELPFDRTVQVSVTDRLEKDQILGRLPHNLRTLDVLLKQNKCRLPDRPLEEAEDGGAARGLGPAWPPPPPVRAADRGTRPADPADRGDDPHARGLRAAAQGAESEDRGPQEVEAAALGPAEAGRRVS